MEVIGEDLICLSQSWMGFLAPGGQGAKIVLQSLAFEFIQGALRLLGTYLP